MGLEGPLSVLVPVRNGQGTVGHALGDLLVGMGDHDELLVIDDGSEDSTPEILTQVGSGDPRVRVLKTGGTGLVRALNLGLAEARHDWIARADADDRYPCDRLQGQRAAVTDDVVLVSGDYRAVSGERHLGEIPGSLTPPFVVASLIHPQRVPHPGVLFNRQAVQAAGGYRQEDFPAEDLALWLRLAREGDLVGTPTRVLDWTMGGASITHTRQASQRQRTWELITSAFPIDLLRSLTEADVEREIDAYMGTPLEAMRLLLLYRDLDALVGRGLSSRLTGPVRHAMLRSPVQTSMAAWQLWKGKRRRYAVRRGFEQDA